MSGLTINTGTGPSVAATMVGTDYIQLMSVANTPTVTVSQPVTVTASANPVVITGAINIGVTSLTATTGSFTVTGPVFVTNTGGAFNVGTVTTVLGVVAVSGGGGGVQYGQGTTGVANTATGTVLFGIQSTTAFAIGITGSNQALVSVANSPTVTVGNSAAISVTATGVTIASVATGTFTISAMPSVVLSGTPAVTAANVTIASVTTGTMNVVNVLSASGITVASVATGTFTISAMPSVVVSSVTTGTFSMSGTGNVTIAGTPAVTAANVTVASVTTGTMNVVNVLTGNMIVVATAKGVAGGITFTGHASQFQSYVLATTSAAGGVIVKTSGASTLYITDIIMATPSALNAGLYSETTGPLMYAYFASNGGLVANLVQPLICTTAQSLRVILSSSGTCSVSVVGYTVT